MKSGFYLNFRLYIFLNSYDVIKEAFVKMGDDFVQRNYATFMRFLDIRDGEYLHCLNQMRENFNLLSENKNDQA